MTKQIGLLAWQGQLEDGFELVWPLYGYFMRGRQGSNRGFNGLIEDISGYGPQYRGQNLRMGAFRSNGWCILVDMMLDKNPLERSARRLSVNFKRPTIAAMSNVDGGHFYVGYWDGGRHQGHVDAHVKDGHVDVEGGIVNGTTDPSKWDENDWAHALTELGLDIEGFSTLDPGDADFEIIEVRREFIPEPAQAKVETRKADKPWWKLWN